MPKARGSKQAKASRNHGLNGLSELADELEDNENDWLEIEQQAEFARAASLRHAELWKEVRESLKMRDCWNERLQKHAREGEAIAAPENQIEELQVMRGQVATARSRQIFHKRNAYSITYERAKKVDAHMMKLLDEIRDMEQNPNLTLDVENRLDDELREAVLQNDVSRAKSLLQNLPKTTSTDEVDEVISSRKSLAIKDAKHRLVELRQAEKRGESVEEARKDFFRSANIVTSIDNKDATRSNVDCVSSAVPEDGVSSVAQSRADEGETRRRCKPEDGGSSVVQPRADHPQPAPLNVDRPANALWIIYLLLCSTLLALAFWSYL